MLDMLVLGLPFACLVGAAVSGYIPEKWFGHTYVTGALIALIALFRQIRRFKYMTCDSCYERLHADELREDEPITFTCDNCRVIWRTGFHHSTD